METATAKCSQKNRPQPATSTPSLLEAAKVVVALSGWASIPDGREIYQSSYMAMAVLKRAIEEAENPVLQLAPEPLPRGL